MEWRKVVEPPSPEFVQFRKDSKWFSEHCDELAEQYADNWVGVYKQEVIGASPDSVKLIKELRAKGYNVGHVFFYYLAGEEIPRVLGSSLNWSIGQAE